MTNIDKEKIDEYFRLGLSVPDPVQVDEDWALMRARLENADKRNLSAFYISFITSVAAIMLIAFAVFFYSGEITETEIARQNVNQSDGVINSNQSVKSAQNGSSPVDFSQQVSSETNIRSTRESYSSITPELTTLFFSTIPNETDETRVDTSGGAFNVILATDTQLTPDNAVNTISDQTIANTQVQLVDAEQAVETDYQPKISKLPVKSRFSMAFNVAPDVSGVDQFQAGKMGYSLGAGVHYSLSKKITIESGVAFSQKSYQTGFSSFRPPASNIFPVLPSNVTAGFELIDIQLNMAYNLLNHAKYSVGIAAGISSYLMLDEEYSFDYQNMNAHGVRGFSTGYQNNHFLGIANVGLRFKRNLTPNTKLTIDPYFKLPLTDLGYGNIRLRSAGVSVGVVTNLNLTKK